MIKWLRTTNHNVSQRVTIYHNNNRKIVWYNKYKWGVLRNTIIYIILIVLVALGGVGYLAWRKYYKPKSSSTTTTLATTQTTTSTGTTSSNITTIDTSTILEKSKQNFTLAKQKATSWKSDAVFYNLTIKFPPTLDIDSGTETYTYGSASDPTYWWTISISQSTGSSIRAIIPKEDYLTDLKHPAPLGLWKINYAQALQAAETAGGATYRTSSTLSEINLSLASDQTGQKLYWTVEYKGVSDSKKIIIDGESGQAFDEQGNAISTSTSSTTTSTSSSGFEQTY